MERPHPTVALWALLARPLHAGRAVEALLGLSPAAARLLGDTLLASSPEADRLVAEMPRLLRSVSIATAARSERCHGEVRGPIQWGETMAARGASAGDTTLFVCAIARRAYDTAENRVLATALRTLAAAAASADASGLRRRNSTLARHVRHNGGEAVRFADHRALAGVPVTRPHARELRRARSGRRRSSYRSALALLDRAAQPFGADTVAELAGPRTVAQHQVVVQVVTELRRRGRQLPPLRTHAGTLFSGPVRYVPAGARTADDAPPGVQVGDLLLDVAVDEDGALVDPQQALTALAARAGDRNCAVIAAGGDVAWALDQAGW